MKTQLKTTILTIIFVVLASVCATNSLADTEVSGDQFDGDGGPWTVSGSPYIVTGNVNVPEGETLTIKPGVEVKFDGDYGIDVFGTLIANGTSSEENIVFTSNRSTKDRGDWKSIYFENTGGNSVMDYCTVKYGGSDKVWGLANICVDGISTVTISHTTSRYSNCDGISVKNKANPTITDCTFEDNGDDAIDIEVNSYPVLRDNSAQDNVWNGISVKGGHIEVSGTWYADNIPYIIDDGGVENGNRNIKAGVTLTIQAGTVIKFECSDSQPFGDEVRFRVYGTLDARGTDANRIIFTSLADDYYLGDTNGDGPSSGSPKDWENIIFEQESVDNVLQHCVFKYGGEDGQIIAISTDSIIFEDCVVSDSGSDGIHIEDASPTISRTQISNNSGDGIYCVNASPTIDGCTFSDNGNSPLHLRENSFPTYTGENTSTISTTDGSVWNGILVDGEVTVDGTLHKGFVPYIINQKDNDGGPRNGVTLTIDPGTILKFKLGAYDLNVYGSALVAVGTADEPIVFTSLRDDEYGGDTNGDGDSSGEPSDWSGIEDCQAGGQLDYCTVRFAGHDPQYALQLDGTASLPVTNCTFEEIGGEGAIWVGSGYDNVISNCTIINNLNHGIDCDGGTVTISDCTIKNNGEDADGDGIWVHNGSNATIENCIISGNQEDGIDAGNSSSVIVKNCVIANNGVEGTNEGYGIGFWSSSTGTIENCEIFGSYRDGIRLNGSEDAVVRYNTIIDNGDDGIDARNGASATITECNISHNDYDGINCDGSTLEISYCIIKGNGMEGSGAAGLYVHSSGVATINNSIIAHNRYWGVRCSSNSDANATNNWWGHSSGPYHEDLNPDGLGDVVSDHVFIKPWLSTAPPLEPTCPPCEPGDVSGDGTVSAYDAALILQFVVGLISEFPVQRVGAPDGNITPRHYTVSVAEHFTQAGRRIVAPILIDDANGLLAGGISLKYDPSILRAVDVFPTTLINSSYWKANTNLEGEVRFAFAATEPSRGKGNLLMVEFEVMPHAEGQTSPLILDNVSISDSLGITRINGFVTILPARTRLLQNFPNPFNPETWLPYQLAEDANVTIRVYNAKGQIVRSLYLGSQRAGSYTTRTKATYWDGRDDSGERVASGVYFYTLHAGEIKATRKMTILK